jgi:hypothetical protein
LLAPVTRAVVVVMVVSLTAGAAGRQDR